MFNISYSEIDTFKNCERLWYYENYMRLISKTDQLQEKDYLFYGIIGHKWLSIYYETLNATHDVATSIIKAQTVIAEAQAKGYSVNWCLHLMGVMARYVAFTRNNADVEILGTEIELTAPLPYKDHPVGINGIIDLVIDTPHGVKIVDHKFTYNFKTRSAIEMSAQLPLYAYLLERNGFSVADAELNQIRYRDMDDEKNERFRRTPIPVDEYSVDTFVSEHTQVAEYIADLVKAPRKEVEANVVRAATPKACEYCPMFTICKLEKEGDHSQARNVVNAFFTIRDDKYGVYSK